MMVGNQVPRMCSVNLTHGLIEIHQQGFQRGRKRRLQNGSSDLFWNHLTGVPRL